MERALEAWSPLASGENIWCVANQTMHSSDVLSSYHSGTQTQGGGGNFFSLILISALSQRVAKRACERYVGRQSEDPRRTELPVFEKYLEDSAAKR